MTDCCDNYNIHRSLLIFPLQYDVASGQCNAYGNIKTANIQPNPFKDGKCCIYCSSCSLVEALFQLLENTGTG